MAIKVVSQGVIPAVDVEFLQYTKFNMAITKTPPYRIAVTSTIHPYGKVDGSDIQYFSGEEHNVSLQDVHAWVATLEGQDQADAAMAMQKINEGFGILAEKYLGITFVEYEP